MVFFHNIRAIDHLFIPDPTLFSASITFVWVVALCNPGGGAICGGRNLKRRTAVSLETDLESPVSLKAFTMLNKI